MRIITYSDPFKIMDHEELKSLMKNHPLFCASDTLVQGMTRYYGRDQFSIIRSVQHLLDAFCGEYINNQINDMQLYLKVTDCIHQWPESAVKDAFLFNKSEVVRAIQFLIPFEFDPDEFNLTALNDEQQLLINLYREIKNSSCFQQFNKLRRKGIIDFQEAVRNTQITEINYQCNNEKAQLILKNKMMNPIARNLSEANRNAKAVLAELPNGPFVSEYEKHLRKNLETALEALKVKPDEYYQTVVIQGVHNFTPILYYLLNFMEEKLKINVVFAIQYSEGLPTIYNTGKQVYRWTDTKFENIQPLSCENANSERKEMVRVLQGKKNDIDEEHYLLKYDNLTAFSMHEAGLTYEASDSSAQSERLNRMKTQYYAVKGKDCNEILQMFYPEQFKSKPFLSYPIGQFILGIYHMWDFDRNEICFKYDSLEECAVSGLFHDGKLLSVLRKTKLFFTGAETYAEFRNRINLLKDTIQNGLDEPYDGLKRISFFSVTYDELETLQQFLDELKSISETLFSNQDQKIDYHQHFKQLIDRLSAAFDTREHAITATEKALIAEIREELNTDSNRYIEGNIQDVSDALAFFLSGKKESDSSNWIVRDFEQLDGAVLLSDSAKAEKYHFALISNEHMLTETKDELPWPLTVELFHGYEKVEKGVQAVVSGIKERSNFLKYSLFYGFFFSRKPVVFSYVEEENGEEQTPYYLFEALGYQKKRADTEEPSIFHHSADEPNKGNWDFPRDPESKELFSVCPFKYLLNKLLHSEIIYYSEFHIKYFLSYYLTYIVRAKCNNPSKYEVNLNKEIETIKKIMPFWGETVFQDLSKDSLEALNQYHYSNDYVHRRKCNFLVARWDDAETNWSMDFRKANVDDLMEQYSKNAEIYPTLEDLPRNTICMNCNYSGICLRDFYASFDEARKPDQEDEDETL